MLYSAFRGCYSALSTRTQRNKSLAMRILARSPPGCDRWPWPTVITLLLSTSWSCQAHGQSQHDFLFFTSVDAFKIVKGESTAVDDEFVRPTVDFLYSYSGDRFRFLAEYLWSSEEHELERMKAGWRMADQTMLWAGRYHATAKYWTSEYHHGQFMQTSITRPGIEEWEDESGPMPSHVTGLSLEHETIRTSESATNYAFSVGLAPKFISEELVPFDILDPESGNDIAVNYRMVYRPSIVSASQIGLLTAWNEINVVSESSPNLENLDHIRQFTLGVFGDWTWDKWRLIANLVYFNNDMQYGDGPVEDEFGAGYIQGEYKAAKNWTIFGRSENGFNEDNSLYLSLLPAFIAHRNMIGVRWDFASFQSFTMEVADTSTQGDALSHESFKEFRIQWSAVFP
jgi:hypothetical protein